MKKLELLLSKLHSDGFSYKCHWEMPCGNHTLQYFTIMRSGDYVNVIFMVFANDSGFTHFIESNTNTIGETASEFEKLLP